MLPCAQCTVHCALCSEIRQQCHQSKWPIPGIQCTLHSTTSCILGEDFGSALQCSARQCSIHCLHYSAIQCTAVHCIPMKMYCNTMQCTSETDLQCKDRKRAILCPIFPQKLSPASSVDFHLCFSLVLSTCWLSDNKPPCCCVVVCTHRQVARRDSFIYMAREKSSAPVYSLNTLVLHSFS